MQEQNISLLISSFGRLPLFAKSISSIKPQLTEEDELVIVEDGKNNDWVNWLDTQGVKYQYVKTHNTKYRSGCMAKNIALKLAKNPIIIINDPEVEHLTPCINQIKEHLKKDPRGFIVAGDAYFGKQANDVYNSNSGHIPHSQAPFVGGVMKKELIAVGGWDERFKFWGNDDNDLMHRLGLNEVHHIVDDEMLIFHQWHERPPAYAIGDYNHSILNEENKSIIANKKGWGKMEPWYGYFTNKS
jgi:glycosyltransferase involved in cell wall biosynthesis